MFKGILTNRRYFTKLFIWFTAAISIVVVILAILAYLSAQKIFVKSEYEVSQKLLKQLKFNIEFVDETIGNSCKFLFLNPDISYLLNSSEISFDQNELYRRLNNTINPILLSNSYIHSVCIYNSNGEQYYYAGKSTYFDDKDLKQMIHEYPNTPKQKPILRRILYEYGKTQEYENVLTYIMYETSGSPRRIDNAVVINVRPEWILDNIFDMGGGTGEQIFVMDNKGSFLGNFGEKQGLGQLLRDEYDRNKGTGEDTPGLFVCTLLDREYMVTYDDISDIGFILFKIQPIQEVYKYVDTLRMNILVIAAIALLLSILAGILISNKLYTPLGRLIKQIAVGKENEFDFEQYDEIAYLNNVYKYSMGKLNQYYDDKIKNRNILKAYWLKELLTGGERINQAEYEEICSENMINLPYDFTYIVCVLKIDGFKEFQRTNDLKNRELIRFAIINIMTEILAKNFAVEGVDVSEEKVVLLIGTNSSEPCDINDIINTLKEGQDYIKQYFDITVTAAVGEKVESFSRVAESYEKAVEYSLYRFVLGKKSIVVREKIEKNYVNANQAYSKGREVKLIESIRTRNAEEIKKDLRDILDEISQLSIENIMHMLINLADAVKTSLNMASELESNTSKYGSVDLAYMIYEAETIDEFYHTLLKSLEGIMKGSAGDEADMKSRIISETVVEIIHKNYWDKGLCANQIASLLKMNPRRMAKAFKDVMAVSIPDYINNVRLDKAAELLENTKLNVYDIKDKIGFDNESYFYRLFKTKFGYTPKDYSLHKNVQSQLSSAESR